MTEMECRSKAKERTEASHGGKKGGNANHFREEFADTAKGCTVSANFQHDSILSG
jgi:hypothetical protein